MNHDQFRLNPIVEAIRDAVIQTPAECACDGLLAAQSELCDRRLWNPCDRRVTLSILPSIIGVFDVSETARVSLFARAFGIGRGGAAKFKILQWMFWIAGIVVMVSGDPFQPEIVIP